MDNKDNPKWCDYPVTGDTFIDNCWSLLYGYVKDEDYCKNCEFYIKK